MRAGAGIVALVLLAAAGAGVAPRPARAAAASSSVQLEDLTWPELQARVRAGATTALVPIGGTEQSGPQIALGKHNARVRVLAERIALRLGDAIVAPVVAYVPEGSIDPPTQHMRWPGTISIPVPAFEATLAGAARSLLAHGFCHVVFLGDHGGYRESLVRAAAAVARGRPAPRPGCGALALPAYYRAADTDFAQALKAQGFSAAEIGTHAGLADTALTLATAPALVRTDPATLARGVDAEGGNGDPRRATAALGRAGADHVVDVSVAAIRAALRGARR
ncbi:MAG: creatininase family protein [Burkholderiales bacterium]|nr:creatininase family protein [Burkholderiales bacterium]